MHSFSVKSDASTSPWSQPPLVPLERLPLADPSRQLEISEYQLMLKNLAIESERVDSKNVIIRKVVLNEIEKIPKMWMQKNTMAKHEMYSVVAVEVYKRTGALLRPRTIQQIFKTTKDCLRNRLKVAIVRRHLTPMETEEHLWKWSYYGFIRFFRLNCQQWEMRLRSMSLRTKNGEPLVLDVETDDDNESVMEVDGEVDEHPDIIWDDAAIPCSSSTPDNQQCYSEYHPEEAEFEKCARQSKTLPVNAFQYQNYQIARSGDIEDSKNEIRRGTEPESDRKSAVTSSSTTQMAPSVPVDFREEMSQVTYQATRIAREQPERVKILRKALFDTVLEFDQKEYNSVGELFRELAEKNSK